MRELWQKFRTNWKPVVGAGVLALLAWAAHEMWQGALEGSGWGPKQLASKLVGQWMAGSPANERPKLETGSIPRGNDVNTGAQGDAQKIKEVARRAARKARCEKERQDEWVEAERELAVYEYRARACVAEMKVYLFTRSDPEGACKEKIDEKTASGVRRDAIAARRC